MPIHNFMLDDLAGSVRAVCLFPLFLLIPGYVAAWALDLYEFRRRTEAFRLALAVPLSLGLCPILTYFAGRIGSWPGIIALYSAAWLAFLAIAVLRLARGRWPSNVRQARPWWIFAVIAAAWLAIAIGSLIDLQFGDRLYYPVSALDNSVRTAFVHSVEATGIPPQNPFFSPGTPVPLRYHYFWVMMCSLVPRLDPSAVSTRQSLIGGSFWCGLALMALVLLYLRLFSNGDARQFRRRALRGVLLLGITGLDVIPGVFLLLLYSRGKLDFVLPSVEWWNEHVDWFLYSSLWAPHAVASLIAALAGFLLLWRAPSAPGLRGLLRYALPGGIALASSVGASIYVSFVFAAFLAVWTAITLWKKWHRETAVLLVAGALAAALALPYAMSLAGPAAPNASAGFPLRFTVRAFSMTALVPTRGMSSTLRLLLINGPLIPLNYLFEFGFFFLIAQIQWRKWRQAGRPLERSELASLAMAATATLICTFLRSSVIGCNDLGWRGFLVAQFAVLIWGADLLAEAPPLLVRKRALLTLCLLLGAAGVVYDLAITRAYPILADRGVIPVLDWMGSDRQIGRRTYAARQAYQWARSVTPETAVVQFNPRVTFQETTAMLYADRRALAGDSGCLTGFGGDPALCAPLVSRLGRLFSADFYQTGYHTSGQPDPDDLSATCSSLPIEVVVAKDTDAVWRDRRSWVWTERPAFANAYVRMFRCPGATAQSDIPHTASSR